MISDRPPPVAVTCLRGRASPFSLGLAGLGNSALATAALATAVLAGGLLACSSAGPTISDSPRDVSAVLPDDGQHAPVLYKVGDRVVEVGKPVEIALRAEDADGDTLVYSAHSLPKGATFDKSPPTFRWTPDVVGTIASPTFVVSDGTSSDRETVRIEVVAEAQNHPPRFQKLGDQAVEVGGALELLLQAVDADGDPLTFGVEGTLPGGASLDTGTGAFTFTPPSSAVGSSPTIVFTVTDGALSDSLPVVIYVLAPGQNRPPTFTPLPAQVAFVAVPYSVVIGGTDPDGDPLSFGFEGTLPTGATFDPTSARFTWTPTTADAGGTATFVFSLSDGHYQILGELDVDVMDPSVALGECKDDVNEPNTTAAEATPLTVGDYEKLSLCDTTANPVDEDWFSISLSPGQGLSLTVTFDHNKGDIDVAIFHPDNLEVAVALADGAGDKELVAYTATNAETVLVKVFGSGQPIFTSPYTMSVSTSGLDCDDDPLEPNDTKLGAVAISANDTQSGLRFCPGDLDYYTVPLSCGQTLTTKVEYTASKGALDLWLYRAGAFDAPAIVATKVGATVAALYEAPQDEDVVLLVRGAPPETTLNDYTLVTSTSGAASCTDDPLEPNNTRGDAVELALPTDEKNGLTLCCNEDWYFVPLVVGDGALLQVKFDAGLAVKAELYSVDGAEPIAVAEPDAQGLLVTLDKAPFSGNFYLRVEGPAGTSYGLELVTESSDGCLTSKACDGTKVCHLATGACVSGYCASEADCPTGQDMPCLENMCLAGCTYDADCKLAHTCKGFDIGTYCGQAGASATGAACASFSDCAGQAVCTFASHGGYCSKLACQANSECGSDGSCVQLPSGSSLCAKKCASNKDCRGGDGYTCQPKTLPSGIPTTVCLPTTP